MRIAIVAASSRFSEADRVAEALAPVVADYPGVALDYRLVRDVAEDSHFAGDDAARRDTLLGAANDPGIDAIWFARGGYGASRIALDVLDGLDLAVARRKRWLGYSDPGFLLAGLYAKGCTVAHGPMAKDLLNYARGADTVRRSLNWLTGRSDEGLEPGLIAGQSYAAFNISVLAALLGTPLEPDLSGHVLMLEELDEHLYATDRDMFRILNTASVRRIAELRLGRVQVLRVADANGGTPQPLPFDESAGQIAARWCRDAGVAFGPPADIGHDSGNKVVPFGRFGPPAPL